MLLAHVRNCQNKECPTCHKLRERIRQSRAHQQHQQASGTAGIASKGTGAMRMAPGDYNMGMQGSYNPLVSSGLMGNAVGGYDGWGLKTQGPLYGARPIIPSSSRPGDGQRRNKVKQRGRENVAGLAAPSRQRNTKVESGVGGDGNSNNKFLRIRLKVLASAC